jgi:hypothetical protein
MSAYIARMKDFIALLSTLNHGDYSSIANDRIKFPVMYFGILYHTTNKKIPFIPRLLTEHLTMFHGTLAGKHCLKY